MANLGGGYKTYLLHNARPVREGRPDDAHVLPGVGGRPVRDRTGDGQPPTGSKLVLPDHPERRRGGPLPKAAEQPRKGAKVVFDITADAKPGEVNKGLERVARLLNLYGSAGLKASDVKVAVVFHGEATKTVLTDAAYKTKFGTDTNPNLPVLRELQKAGVELFVCGQALNYKGFKASRCSKEVTVALAALTVVVNRQTDGYAHVPVK